MYRSYSLTSPGYVPPAAPEQSEAHPLVVQAVCQLIDSGGQVGHRMVAVITNRPHDVLIALDLRIGMQLIEGLVAPHLPELHSKFRMEQRNHDSFGVDDDETCLFQEHAQRLQREEPKVRLIEQSALRVGELPLQQSDTHVTVGDVGHSR